MAKKSCCEHPMSEHNDQGCAAPLDVNSQGERNYCRCMNRVHKDLELGAKPKKRLVALERELGRLFR